jgi:hypothetical protein
MMGCARFLFLAVAAIAVATPAAAFINDVPPLKGNDTGGIITWSPITHDYRDHIAQEHCAFYRKLHRIRSVRTGYGNYISFECFFPPETGTVILRRAN